MAAMDPDDRELVVSMLAYIDHLCERKGYEEVAEELEVASQCIRSSFENEIEKVKVEVNSPSLLKIFKAGREALKCSSNVAATVPITSIAAGPAQTAASTSVPGVPDTKLAEICADPQFKKYILAITGKKFFEGLKEGSPKYQERFNAAVLKYLDHFQKMGDNLKAKGNALMGKKDYVGALELYKKAIATCRHSPNAHMYYGNAAAARLNSKDYEGAERDCRAGIALKNDYAKLYKRLGTALEGQQKYTEAAVSYERCISLDPDHGAVYREMKQRAERRAAAAAPSPASPAVGGGMPGMPGGLMGMMNNPDMMRTAQSMMQNPEFMSMAQNMMSNMGGQEGMAKMMANMGGPGGLASMMGGMGGGGGGSGGPSMDPSMLERLRSSPRMAELRNDPEMAAFSEDMQTGGPAAAMKHLSNPRVMQKIMAAMSGDSDGTGTPDCVEE